MPRPSIRAPTSATPASGGGASATLPAFTRAAAAAAAAPAARQSSAPPSPTPTTTARAAAMPCPAWKTVAERAVPSISPSLIARATTPPRAASRAAAGPPRAGGAGTHTTRRSALAASGSADFLRVVGIAAPGRRSWSGEGYVRLGGHGRQARDDRPIRVVIAKPGLDGHDRGAKIIARSLRDAGMEVIYTGLHQTPDQIAATVVQEDADAVGLSILSGAHMTLVPRILDLLRAEDAGEVLVIVGGTIPHDDIPQLKELGVAEVFTPGAPVQEMVDFIRAGVGARAA